jgi:hypothetical protein
MNVDDGLWTRLVDEHEADRVALGLVPEQRSRRPLAEQPQHPITGGNSA